MPKLTSRAIVLSLVVALLVSASRINEASGAYKNWDWHNDNLATYASHWSKIIGYSGGNWTYQASWTHTGEDWWLLHGQVLTY